MLAALAAALESAVKQIGEARAIPDPNGLWAPLDAAFAGLAAALEQGVKHIGEARAVHDEQHRSIIGPCRAALAAAERAALMGAVDIGELRGLLSLQDNFSKPVNDAAKGIGAFSESFGAITGALGIATAAMGAAAGAIVVLGQRGSEVVSMSNSFDSLTRSIGESGDVMLGSMTEATKGLVSNMDLMAAANKAILLGLPVNGAVDGTLSEAAVVLGRAMGQDAKKSLDDLTTALGRSSPMILDNLGLSVNVTKANEAYAIALGKSADELTEAEKKQAFYNAAMEAAQTKVAELGDVQLTFGDRLAQARVMLGNFTDGLGAAIATSPVLAAGLDAIMTGLQAAFGENSQGLITTIVGYINSFAIGLTYVAQTGVSAAEFLANAWSGMKVAFNVVMEAIVGGVELGVRALAGLVEKAAMLPGVGGHLQGLNTALKDMTVWLGAAKQSFSEQTDEALTKSAEQAAAFESARVAIAKVRDAMEAAARSGDQLTTATSTAAANVKTVGEVAEEVAIQDIPVLMAGMNDLATSAATNFQAATDEAEQWGFKTRAELQAAADAAKNEYDRMRASGEFTYSELEKAHKKMIDAQEDLDGKHAKSAAEKFDLIANAASQTLSAIFGKNKAAAIASAIIDTASAVVSSFRPRRRLALGVIPAAAMAIAGAAQIAQIRNTNASFAEGTPGTAFEDFGRESGALLHGQEAVVNVAQGTTLAGMIGDEMARASAVGDAAAREVSLLRDEMRRFRQSLLDDMGIAVRDALATRPRPSY